jgi:hypothetical protein
MRIPYLREAGAVILLALLAWGGHGLYRAGYNAANVRAEKVIGEFAKAEAKAQQDARNKEHALAQANDKAAQAYEQGKADAEAAGKRTTADILAGAVKLRREWQGCETRSLSGAAARAAEPDAAAQDRADGAGRIVRAAREADEQIKGLQDILRAERGR